MANRFTTTIGIALLGGSLLSAGVIPGRWEKVQALNPGAPIVVRLQAGDRLAGLFKELSAEELTITRYEGGEMKFPKSSIAAIQGSERVADTRVDGTLIGLGIGAGSYLGLHAALCCAPDEAHDAAAALFFGGIGALVGFIADYNVKGPEILYREP